MRYPDAVQSSWVPLRIAPFTLRADREHSDRDVEQDAALEHRLMVEPPPEVCVNVDWAAGAVEVSVRRTERGELDDLDDMLHVCARAHPVLLRSALPHSVRPQLANIVASLVDNFWSALIRRHEALIETGILAVYARGGPRPVDGFRRMRPDIWAASTVDWAAGTCTTPDGNVYFSIHVAPLESPSPRATETSEIRIVRADTKAVVRQPTAITDGMDVHSASRFLGISKSSLDKWRLVGSGPPFHRIGSRVRYLEPDLEAWRNRRRSTGTPS